MRLLVVEDYPPLLRSLAQALREAGYVVDLTMDGEQALAMALATRYDGIVLDLMIPGRDGYEVLRKLRSEENPVPVLILTARQEVVDRVKGLDLGADDYLVKPFALEELLARIRAVIRRQHGVPTNVIRVTDLEIDTGARTVKRGGRRVELSAREYALLEYLALRHGETVTRAEICEHLYDFASEPTSNVVDVYIGYLRRKIDVDAPVKLIRTRRGFGYVLGASG